MRQIEFIPFWLTNEVEIYTIKFNEKSESELLILGGGGEKTTQTYQEDPELNEKVRTLQKIDNILSNLEADGMDLNKEIINLTINLD